MAPPDYYEIDCGRLALEIASKPGWTRFASQVFQQGKGRFEVSCKYPLKFCGGSLDRVSSDSHWISRGQTGKWIPESESE
jgi:hypothetical protein